MYRQLIFVFEKAFYLGGKSLVLFFFAGEDRLLG